MGSETEVDDSIRPNAGSDAGFEDSRGKEEEIEQEKK